MDIRVFQDFSVFDAGKQKNIDKIIETMPEFGDSLVSIDFTDCLIDYPATSRLLDKILLELSYQAKHKMLIIKSDLTINNESLILSLLFWGSTFFDFSSVNRTSKAEEFRNIINPKLKESFISMQIRLHQDDGSLFKEFSYE